MIIYGISNVRGGSYCNIELNDDQIELLLVEFRNALNLCYNCGKKHPINNKCESKTWSCYKCKSENKESEGECKTCGEEGGILEWSYEKTDENLSFVGSMIDKVYKFFEINECSRCGRNTHTIKNCYAKTHLNGKKL
jgi:hypothetical protein